MLQWTIFLLSPMGVLYTSMMGNSVTPLPNLALSGQATQSSTYKSFSAVTAINRIRSECSITVRETNPWWRVDLLGVYNVTAVKITANPSYNLVGAEIRIGSSLENNSNSNPRCAVISSIQAGQANSIQCDAGPIEGRYVNVFLPGPEQQRISLCEVEVYGTEVNLPNLALSGKANQSSTYLIDDALKAINGIKSDFSCTHHKAKPWWRVDPLSVYRITAINITSYNQNDIDGAEIHIGNSLQDNGNNNPRCAVITHIPAGQTQTIHCHGPMEGRYVNVYHQEREQLCLSEVEVYSTESPLVLVKERKSWEEALDYCREHHYDLVSIHDEDTQAWAELEATQANTHYVWLGLHYTCTLDFWFWVSGDSSCYTNWAPGNGTGGEDCGMTGAMERGGENRWVARPDTEKLNFICFREGEDPEEPNPL